MANINDYLYWRGSLSFEQAEFNILDNLIFAEMTYIDYKDAVPEYPKKTKVLFKNAMKKIFEMHEKEKIVLGLIVPTTIVDFADRAKDTKRFGDVCVSNYINYISVEEKCQFSALTYHFAPNKIYVAFRGTDDTLIGWQENVDLLYDLPVGAQRKAVEYLDKIHELFPDADIYLGGHSKGGNLANYATIYASDETKEKIVQCYSNDGQGMDKTKMDLEKYETVKKKITRVIPEMSVVGMIFDPFAGHTVVAKSTAKGIYQHDGFSWQVLPDSFDSVPDVSDKAKKMDKALTKIFRSISREDKIALGQNLYDFICASQLNTLLNCKKESIRLLKYLNKFNPKSRQIFFQLLSEFMFY